MKTSSRTRANRAGGQGAGRACPRATWAHATPTEAIRIFYTQISLRGALPFLVEIPNELTAQTLERSRQGEAVEHFESLDSMFVGWET
ncbi:MAG: hypothetical protein GW911_07190 [Armatimonadetes bacterium]|nr:hypothetical protein [Armatimonadota bacterium]NCO90789.1 hypothetical protein [Armatimonadota bacterium]NCQ28729.1 hypothetical protein [Armatimonadota bacterium]NDK11824.1 hypothetical protein [Armatimonadota bacterium]